MAKPSKEILVCVSCGGPVLPLGSLPSGQFTDTSIYVCNNPIDDCPRYGYLTTLVRKVDREWLDSKDQS